MRLKKSTFLFSFGMILFLFYSCGGHGSLKGYRYQTTKENLQHAVMAVIKNNSNIYRDTSLDYLGSPIPQIQVDSEYAQPAATNYYNDVKNYVTIKITSGRSVNEYTFRYYGDEKYWKNSDSSEIFICYAYDKDHKGGSEGNGGVTPKMLEEFTSVFEKEFISKVDSELHLTYTVDK